LRDEWVSTISTCHRPQRQRVPFHFKYFQTEDSEGFRLIDRLVQWSRAENILLILDMHAAPGGQTGSNIDDSDGFPWLFTDASAQQYLNMGYIRALLPNTPIDEHTGH
jgi:hypothetical protein